MKRDIRAGHFETGERRDRPFVRGAKPERDLEQRAARACDIARGEVVVVGGLRAARDSTALAGLLAAACAEAGGSLVLAHVNAGLRPSAWRGRSRRSRDRSGARRPGRRRLPRVRHFCRGPLTRRALRGARRDRARRRGGAHLHGAPRSGSDGDGASSRSFAGAGPAGLSGIVRAAASSRRASRSSARSWTWSPGNCAPTARCVISPMRSIRRTSIRPIAATRCARRCRPCASRISHLDAAVVARCATILQQERAGLPRAGPARASARRARGGDGRRARRHVRAARRRGPGDRAPARSGRHFLRHGVEVVVE